MRVTFQIIWLLQQNSPTNFVNETVKIDDIFYDVYCFKLNYNLFLSNTQISLKSFFLEQSFPFVPNLSFF